MKKSTNTSNGSTTSSANAPSRAFDKASEHSIEVYDDRSFERNSILTRSARIRKFKFYQYKPILDSTPTRPTLSDERKQRSTKSSNSDHSITTPTKSTEPSPSTNNHSTFSSQLLESSDFDDKSDILLPRDDIVQGKFGQRVAVQQSKELSELDEEIVQLEKRIADLNVRSSDNGNGNNRVNNLDEIFDLVNKKNDLLRRQMQLNILEQEKALEKANEELTKELRSLMSIEDSRKSRGELERQQYLYDQSVALVNKRNELVHHMDVQEKGIEEDNALKATLKTVISDTSERKKLNGNDQNCCIQ